MSPTPAEAAADIAAQEAKYYCYRCNERLLSMPSSK